MTEVAENLTNGQGSSERTPATNSIDWEKIAQSHTPFQQYASRRSVVYGTKGGSGSSPGMTHSYLWLTGMVACSQPLAAEAGLEILRKGGNAGKYHPSSLTRYKRRDSPWLCLKSRCRCCGLCRVERDRTQFLRAWRVCIITPHKAMQSYPSPLETGSACSMTREKKQ